MCIYVKAVVEDSSEESEAGEEEEVRILYIYSVCLYIYIYVYMHVFICLFECVYMLRPSSRIRQRSPRRERNRR